MKKEQLEVLAAEVTKETQPDINEEHSYFQSFVNLLTDNIVKQYEIDLLEDEEYVKKLMKLDIEELTKNK